jgi:hypothetical protein
MRAFLCVLLLSGVFFSCCPEKKECLRPSYFEGKYDEVCGGKLILDHQEVMAIRFEWGASIFLSGGLPDDEDFLWIAGISDVLNVDGNRIDIVSEDYIASAKSLYYMSKKYKLPKHE